MPVDAPSGTPAGRSGAALDRGPQGRPPERPAPERPASRPWRPLLRWGLLAVGLAFIVVGIYQGGAIDVLHKAALICLECIGIG